MPGAITQLGWQRDTLLELLIRIYCGKLADAVRQGIPQQYTDQEDDLNRPSRAPRSEATILDPRRLAAEAGFAGSTRARRNIALKSGHAGRPSANSRVFAQSSG